MRILVTCGPAWGLALALCAGGCSNDRLRSHLEHYPLTVSVTGEGGVGSEPEGISCGAECSTKFLWGTEVTLVPRPVYPGGFSGWDGACSGAGECRVLVDAAKTVSARFRHQVSLTLEGTGRVTSTSGALDCTASCTALFEPGQQVILGPSAPAGFSFDGWGGACTGAGSCALTADRSHAVVARFKPTALVNHQLVVNLYGTGKGVVTSTPAGIQCGTACAMAVADGAVVRLTVQDGAASKFAGWSGACAGMARECDVTLDTSKSVNARFDPDQLPCQWSKRFGGTWHDRAGSLAIHSDGSLLIAGSIFGPVSFGASPPAAPSGVHSVFAATFEPDGSPIASFAHGKSASVTLGSSAAWAPDGRVLVHGAFSGSVDLGNGLRSSSINTPGLFRAFLGSYALDGTASWVRPLGATSVTTPDGYGNVAVSQDGTVAVTGEFFEPESFGGAVTMTPKQSDLFVAAYGADGGFRWARSAGADDYDRGLHIASRPGNEWVVTGGFSGASDFGGGTYPATTTDEAFVASYGSSGAHRFDQTFALDAGSRIGHAVAVAADGDLVVVGGFTDRFRAAGQTLTAVGMSDAFVVRMSPAGTVRWAASVGGPAWEEAFAVAVDESGAVAVVGAFYANTSFGGVPATHKGSEDIFVARYSASGAYLGTSTFGGPGKDHAGGVAFDRTGNLLLAGEFENSLNLGFGAMTSAGGTDVFLGCLGK